MKSLLLLSVLCLSVLTFLGQDRFGIAGSNYSPTQTVHINPASIADSKAFVDIHFVGNGIYVQNTAVYLEKSESSLYRQLRNGTEIAEPVFRPTANNKLHLSETVFGPAFTFGIGKHLFGFSSKVRTMVDARRLPEELIQQIVNDFDYAPLLTKNVTVKNGKLSAMAWGDFGLSYGTILKAQGDELITAGLTLKRLIGVGAVGLQLENWNYTVRDGDNIDVAQIDGRVVGAVPTGTSFADANFAKGWGFDLGFTYKLATSSVTGYVPFDKKKSCQTCNYIYKFGASILDIGSLKFEEVNGVQFSSSEEFTWQEYKDLDAQGLDNLIDTLQTKFGGSTSLSGTTQKFALPTALSLQFDYNIGNGFYLYANLIHGFARRNNLGVRRAAQLGVVPRFETRSLEVSLPLRLWEYNKPELGIMLRVRSIIIGSDNFGSLFFKQDVSGSDFYFHFKKTIFRSWHCKKIKGKKTTGKKTGRSYPCPEW